MCFLCACQDAVPVSDETMDEQAIIKNATNYFNLMLEGDFKIFINYSANENLYNYVIWKNHDN